MRSSLIPLPYPDGKTKQARWNDDIVPDMFLPTRRETPMAEELIFYTNPMSRGQIARWMLEEVGAPYETRLLDYGTTMKAAAYLAINPMGKVPAIVHAGPAVTQCAPICASLHSPFPGAAPPPPPTDRPVPYPCILFPSPPANP